MRRILAAVVMAIATIDRDPSIAQSEGVQPRFRAGVEIVPIDVSVLDRNRRPVRGLTMTDFAVLEDGKPEPIVAFSAVEMPDTVVAATGWLRDVGSDVATNQLDVQRIIVIVMDDGMTSADEGTPKIAKQIARAVIDQLGPNDLAAVVFTHLGRSQNFTRDHQQLVAAAESFQPKAIAMPGRFTAAANPRGTMAIVGPPLGCALRGSSNCLNDTLKNVAAALEDTPVGRKAIVLISAGVPYDFSMENLDAGSNLDDLQQTFRSLQRANVNVYPFDPTGLTNDGIIAPRLDSLRTLAEHTGGRVAIATNAPWDQVPQMFLENSSYYLLGIRPGSSSGAGTFRRISVKVNRPDAEVRVRAGYYTSNARVRRNERTAPATGLDKAFRAALPSGALPLEVAVAPLAVNGGKQAVVVVTTAVRRPVSDQAAVERLQVRAAALDYRNHKEQAAHQQTAEVTLRPNALGERRFELHSRLAVRPGRYEIRVAADAAGSAGGVFTQLEIPDFSRSRLSLSGLILGRPRAGQDEGLADLLPLVPTAVRVFTPSIPVMAFVRVYRGGKDALTPIEMRARIIDATARTVFEESTTIEAARFQSGRATDFRLELPLTRLREGDHLLTLEAGQAKNVARREVRFRVKSDS